ncbi:MAG: GspH/FimT family pseudopilin [Gallionella sp.]|nr:GspH/FimT family pseudopilin [Gallionella sp.]
MLNCRHSQRGVSMIELLIGLVIIGILAAIGVPALGSWIQNGQIRVTAEAIQNGLQLARAEAVHRNTSVRFQLTTTTDNACALSTTNSNWVISLDDPTGACASTPSDTVAPRIIQIRPSSEGSRNAVVGTTVQSTFIFNGLGRLTTAADTIAVSNPTGGACATIAAPNGPMRCLNVAVTTGGQIRMCNPAKASTDPQGC